MRRCSPRRLAGALTGVVSGVVTGVVLAASLAGCSGDDRSAAQERPQPPAGEIASYVALGDSYTAAPFVPTTALTGCLRSSGNYPQLLAAELEVTTLDDRSCSGARTRDLSRPQPVVGGPVPAQLAGVRRDTDLVTLGIGGNDFDLFATLVVRCVGLRDSDPDGSPCADEVGGGRNGAGDDPLEVAAQRIRGRVARAAEAVSRRAPDATVVLVGYPQIVPASGSCPDLLPLAEGDYAYARDLNEQLADAIEDAADDAGVEYADVWSASEGHDICADDPWIAGSQTDTGRALAYHPYAEEQRAVADLVEALL